MIQASCLRHLPTLALLLLIQGGATNAFSSVHSLHERTGIHLLPPPKPGASNVADLYFPAQTLDHFAPPDHTHDWSQRYFINDTYYGGEGFPVFLMIGGEGPLDQRYVDGAFFMSELARKHRAMQVAVEHRFYGKSFPTEDMSSQNLRYLHSEQALADLVTFKRFFVAKHLDNSDRGAWIAFGGSYPGALTAWARLKFPHLFAGGVASSAPVNTHTDFSEYMETVSYALQRFGGDSCVNAVRDGAQAVAEALQSRSGRDKLQQLFNLCEPVEQDLDIATFESELMGTVQGIVQYNRDGKPGLPTVSDLCAVAKNASEPIFVLKDIEAHFGQEPAVGCFDTSYKSSLRLLQNTTFDGESAMRQWTWQTCVQFGMFQTANSASEPFHSFSYLDVSFYNQICKDAFGLTEPPATEFSNGYYGNDHIAGTNIVFPNGNVDPWHTMGVTNSTPALKQPSEHAVFIDGTAHCADMYAPQASDYPSLQFAREQIASQVWDWISQLSFEARA